jgi:hypothetical protein
MICQININNGIPIYEQISRQVKFAIANGSLLVREHEATYKFVDGERQGVSPPRKQPHSEGSRPAARQEVVVTRTFFFSKVSLWNL